MNDEEKKVFGILANCETSSYTTLYPPERVVVSTKEIAKMLGWTRYRVKKAVKALVLEGVIERASCGNPAVESIGEYSELVYDAMPPKNGFAISEKGFGCDEWKETYKEWSDSMARWANGTEETNETEDSDIF